MILKVKFTLSIGFPTAVRKEILKIEVGDNATEDEIEEQLNNEWQLWITNYLDGGAEIIER